MLVEVRRVVIFCGVRLVTRRKYENDLWDAVY